jgi:nucleoside-diphosphate-sugar epimerase
MKIGVIGNGFVGSAVANGFSKYDVKVFDKNFDLSKNSLEEVFLQDFAFVSVPTPMKDAMGSQGIDC